MLPAVQKDIPADRCHLHEKRLCLLHISIQNGCTAIICEEEMLVDRTIYWFSRPVIGTYAGTMLKMNIRKHSQIPDGPKIIAANHPTTTDPFFVAAMVKHQTFILINDLLFQVPILGEYLRRSGHIPVAAGRGQEAIDTALAHLKAGHNIMIFPEGALSPIEGGFQKSRTGVARLAVESGAPVIPVGIALNKEKIQSIRSTVKGRVEYGRWYLKGPYHMTVGKPVFYGGNVENREHIRRVADNVMHHIIELAHESDERLKMLPGGLSNALNPL